MKSYHAPYALDRVPAVATAVRAVAALAVVATLAGALATAGPGNGHLPQEQWAAAHRQDVVRVTLPKVDVVGQRLLVPEHSLAAVACPKGA